ncbi:MAG: hypothetical protein HOE90_22635 [Bacteriovoracaceae bacterium]|nr:hypothetical protein [Bacteriovoracaceae bacterium]
MPRKNLIRTNLYYYHITTRANNKEWFCLPLDKVWEISKNSFLKAQRKCPAIVSQFVLMNNHYHLLIKTPDSNIDQFMFWFNKTFSDLLRAKTKRVNRMFGSSYKWSIIYDEFYLLKVARYIYQNPLRAGIVTRCEDYQYSTLFYLSRNLEIGYPLESKIIYENHSCLINEAIFSDELNQIKKGLKKTEFKLRRPRK